MTITASRATTLRLHINVRIYLYLFMCMYFILYCIVDLWALTRESDGLLIRDTPLTPITDGELSLLAWLWNGDSVLGEWVDRVKRDRPLADWLAAAKPGVAPPASWDTVAASLAPKCLPHANSSSCHNTHNKLLLLLLLLLLPVSTSLTFSKGIPDWKESH